ncbi:MAG TPA: ATP-binding protein [Kofleriaceae bacterium]|jgi:signal transduction histidine kinase
MGALRSVLSAGVTDALPDGLVRRVRVTNAIALIGMVLSLLSVPIDWSADEASVVLADLAGAVLFGACWWFNVRGRLTTSRLVLMATGNVVIFIGVLGGGASPELRTVFFPLALMPFMLCELSERWKLGLFASLPIAAYFISANMPQRAPESVLRIYLVYAPALAFTLLVLGSVVFAYVERSTSALLSRTQARAAQASRMVALGEMATGIGHEIRNPLAAIQLAAAHITEHPNDPEEVKKMGERIQRIVTRADRIIDALRSFARDASADPFADKPVARIIEEALELCGKRFTDYGIELGVQDVPPNLLVSCRSVQLAQVLVNLLSNAFDAVASASAGWVKIDVREDAGQFELAVSDSGAAMSATTRARLFEPFFTTKGPDRGTGLGLSLSKSIVEAHHGTLALDAAAAHTRFVIRLPLARAVASS